jgi:hypothetical protein
MQIAEKLKDENLCFERQIRDQETYAKQASDVQEEALLAS